LHGGLHVVDRRRIDAGFSQPIVDGKDRIASTRQEQAPKTVELKRRYYRWIEMGVLDAVLAALAREADLAWLMIDSTIVRAHQHAAGARKAKGGRMPRAWVGLEAV
jgi:transposase